MSKLSPLQNVKKIHGSKDQLISKVAGLFTPAEGESPEDFAKRLKYVANAKLLRLAEVGDKIKQLGGAAALVTKVAELKGQSKDKDYAAALGKLPLPRLLDTYQSLSRKQKAAKAAEKTAKPAKAEKAAPKAAAAKPADKTAAKPAKAKPAKS